MILEGIHSPQDVKKLSVADTGLLCEELRAFLLQNVSQTGGHLASNLGAVELTVAIHRVFNTARDRLVFDVGHQCYVHKALTGRMKDFSRLRQFGGLSGFPKPEESIHDAFVAGHASNSVSVALGMARARTMLHENYRVIALMGDGALSGGLAYEGLNNAGVSGEDMLVIFNDNGMSINRNVGAISDYLSKLRNKPEYYALKEKYRSVLNRGKVGQTLYQASHNVKTKLKAAMLQNASLVEGMGFTYIGPVDGHDLWELEEALRTAKSKKGPVFLHVLTQKGKGYQPAEEKPNLYHGVPPFDLKEGLKDEPKESFSSVFGEELCAIAKENERVCAITAAMADGTGLSDFAKQFPERFFDVGIAEEHAAAMAGGLASQGAVPVFAVYSTFLQRAYDQLIHDIALENLHVVLAVDREGLAGADGATHHGIFDATFLSDIPNFTVLRPSNYAELRTMLRKAVYEIKGPVAVSYPRGAEGTFREDTADQRLCVLRKGADVTLCAYGTMINHVLEAADILQQKGIFARVIKFNTISPLLDSDFRDIIGATKHILVAEECLGVGCLGQRIAAILAANKIAPQKLMLCNFGKTFPHQGSTAELQKAFGLDARSIADEVLKGLKE